MSMSYGGGSWLKVSSERSKKRGIDLANTAILLSPFDRLGMTETLFKDRKSSVTFVIILRVGQLVFTFAHCVLCIREHNLIRLLFKREFVATIENVKFESVGVLQYSNANKTCKQMAKG